MTKFCGKIGFIETIETSPGVWMPQDPPIEKCYTGDVIKNYRRWDNSQEVNDDFNINNSISVVADSYIFEHLNVMKYVTWMGIKWKITSIEIQRPRIILTIGGVYNG